MALNKDFKTKNGLCVGDSLMVTNSACIGGDTTIHGNLSVCGDETVLRTIISTTSALSVINSGTGPALWVEQTGSNEPIAEFIDKEGGRVLIDDGGNVGINTNVPNEKLTVAGNISARDGLSAGGLFKAKGIETISQASGWSKSGIKDNLYIINSADTSDYGLISMDTNGLFKFQIYDDSGDRIGFYVDDAAGATTETLTLKTAKVGIGNTAPTEALTINGNLTATGGISTATGFSATGLSANYFASNVGIGTNAPDEALHVFNGCIDTRGIDVENSTVQLYFDGNNGNGSGTSNDLGAGITWKPAYSAYTKRSAGILSIGEGHYFRSGLAFFTNGTEDRTTDWSERMRISMDGNVGIGDPEPTEKLTITGNLTATGTLSAAGDIITQSNVYGVKVCGGTAVCAPAVCGTTSVCGPAVCGTTSVCSPAVCGTTSVCSPAVCGSTSVCGALVCSTGDICTSGGIVYGGGCVCGSNVTDGYSCLDGSGNVCASHCVCAGADVLAGSSGSVCATGGTVCGYYGCFTYLYANGAQVYASSIPNSCLANSSVSYGGVSVALGASCATPPFTLGDTTVVGDISSNGGLSAFGFQSLGGKVGISNDSQVFDWQSTDNEAGLHIKSKGDVALILEGDSDNSGESDNPKIKLIQDGGAVCGSIHMSGNASSTYRIPANSMVMGSYDDYPVAIVQNGYAEILVDASSNVGIGTCSPSEKLTVMGNISAVAGSFCGPQTNYTTLTDAAQITWNACDGHAATVTLGGNRTLNNPTNLAQGSYLLKVVQDGTGSRTLSTFTDYCWPGGVAPTLTTGANAVDILTFWSDGSKLYGGVQYNFG